MTRKGTPPEEYPTAKAPPQGAIGKIEGAARFLYFRARDDVSAIWRAGWRPALGFVGVWVALFAFYIAPARGIEVDGPSTLGFLTLVFVQALARGAEKHLANRTPAAG